MKTGALAAIGSLLVFSSVAFAQQTPPRSPGPPPPAQQTPPISSGVPQPTQPTLRPLPPPASLRVPEPPLSPPPPASLRVPTAWPVNSPPFVSRDRGLDGDGFAFGFPNLWYGAFFPYPYSYPYPYPYAYPYGPKHGRRLEPKPVYVPYGSLQLNVTPGTAQVYVDGFYVGIVDDFGMRGRRLDLQPGSHRIVLRAAGYQELAFDVYIDSNRTIVYRGDLEPLRVEPPPPRVAPSPPAAPSPPSTPRMFYVIPNCYAGDIPPAVALPKGCNVGDMRTRRLN